jgi:CubicO group peptidase (beta-lactamase class C family)
MGLDAFEAEEEDIMNMQRLTILARTVSAVATSTALVATTALLPVAAQATAAATPPKVDLRGVAPLPLTGERAAAFEAFVADALDRYGVPGASVAVVQDGEVVYLRGFGVREQGGTDPVTPDTMMMIGSVTKSMTTMLAATLVDDGRLTWETPVATILPSFAAGDAEMTGRLTVRDAFCNCTGLPGRDLEFLFAADELTPEKVVASLKDVAPTAGYGERFLYNNLLVAAGGLALGATASSAPRPLGEAYDLALRERVLGPIGMTGSTFDPVQVLASGDYALPHAAGLSEHVRPLPLRTENVSTAVAPAGALWSNAREMARYLQTELSGGVAPNGRRVVSGENLAVTWAKGVAMPAQPGHLSSLASSMSSYGLGWMSGEYYGQRVINHSGGTYGFASQAAFLPEAGVGIVVLTNARTAGGMFPWAVQYRLFELLFDQEPRMDTELRAIEDAALSAGHVQSPLGPADRTVAVAVVGRYAHPVLKDVTVSLEGDRLVLDTGELTTELRARESEAGHLAEYAMYDPPLSLLPATVAFENGADGQRRLVLTLPGIPGLTSEEQRYVFEPI